MLLMVLFNRMLLQQEFNLCHPTILILCVLLSQLQWPCIEGITNLQPRDQLSETTSSVSSLNVAALTTNYLPIKDQPSRQADNDDFNRVMIFNPALLTFLYLVYMANLRLLKCFKLGNCLFCSKDNELELNFRSIAARLKCNSLKVLPGNRINVKCQFHCIL